MTEENHMDRRVKVWPSQVDEAIAESDRITIGQLAKQFDVTPDTIRTKLRALRHDGEPIIHDGNGLFKMDKVRNAKDADAIRRYVDWVLSATRGVLSCGAVTKPLIAETKRQLREKLTKEERATLAGQTMLLTRLLDYVTVDEESE